jgi:prevent-host-death family protein
MTIRSLKHNLAAVLERVAGGESVEIRNRNTPVALLTPIPAPKTPPKPDFKERLRSVYGDTVLSQTATELINEDRGVR